MDIASQSRRSAYSYENVTPVRINAPVTSFVSGSPPIMSTMVTPPSTYQPVNSQRQVNSFSDGLDRMALSLERCIMNKLTEAYLEQSTVSKQLFVSGQLPKLTISVFNTLCGRVRSML